jgi:hypothetical protein
MVVHYVEVNDVCSSSKHIVNVFAKIGEVG